MLKISPSTPKDGIPLPRDANNLRSVQQSNIKIHESTVMAPQNQHVSETYNMDSCSLIGKHETIGNRHSVDILCFSPCSDILMEHPHGMPV